MGLRFSGIIALAGALALAGCQSYPPATAGAGSSSTAAAAFSEQPTKRRTVQEFMDMNPHMALVDGKVVSADRRVFIFESAPQIVTTTLPAYTPPARHYNNAAFGDAANSLTAAVGTVPAVSQSVVMVCRLTVHAEATRKGSTPSDWVIFAVAKNGNCA